MGMNKMGVMEIGIVGGWKKERKVTIEDGMEGNAASAKMEEKAMNKESGNFDCEVPGSTMPVPPWTRRRRYKQPVNIRKW